MLSASQVGALHKRERWFLLATKSRRSSTHPYSNGVSYGEQELEKQPIPPHPEGLGPQWQNPSLAYSDERRLQTTRTELEATGVAGEGGEYRWAIKSDMDRMVDGISDRLVEGLPDYLRASYWEEEPCERVTQEREQRVERIKRLGNAVVPLQARTAFLKLMHDEARQR
jgi:hypothetical protein